MRYALTAIAVYVLFAAPAHSQTQASPNPTQQRVTVSMQTDGPLYHVTVVGHSTPAVNYRYRSGEPPIDFEGTPLLPHAKGHATVETKRGFSDIDAHFRELEPATKFLSNILRM